LSLGLKRGHIPMQEADRRSGRSQPGAKLLEHGSRDIEDGQIAIPRREQLVDEEGSPTADIDDGIRDSRAGSSNELYRLLRAWLIPTDLVSPLLLIHLIPVVLPGMRHLGKPCTGRVESRM